MPAGTPTWPIDPARLAGTRFASVVAFDELGSTNTELMERARAGAPEGLVVVADHQTAGRGRLGRTWSVVLMAAGLAGCDGVEAAAGFRPRRKWPNDMVVGDRKLAGLLTESSGGDDPAIVLGLGVNVAAGAYPPELAAEATSCDEHAGRPVDRAEVLVALLTALESRYATVFAPGGRAATLDAYRSDSATLGRRVRVELTSGPPLEGQAARLADDGELVVVDDAGAEHLVNVGDVKHLRS